MEEIKSKKIEHFESPDNFGRNTLLSSISNKITEGLKQYLKEKEIEDLRLLSILAVRRENSEIINVQLKLTSKDIIENPMILALAIINDMALQKKEYIAKEQENAKDNSGHQGKETVHV